MLNVTLTEKGLQFFAHLAKDVELIFYLKVQVFVFVFPVDDGDLYYFAGFHYYK